MTTKMTLIPLAVLLAACQSTSVPQPDLSQTVKIEQHSKPLIHYPSWSSESLFYTYHLSSLTLIRLMLWTR